MVNSRLAWILETRELLDIHQNGCIKNRSTLDSLALMEHDILKGMARREVTVAIGLDIEKAFDLTWQHKVLTKLNNWNIKGRIFAYLKEFLCDRKIQVKIKNSISSPHNLENGILQGSSLSATLWNIVISDVIRLKYNLNNLQIKDILGDNPRTIDLLFKFLKDSNLLSKL
ncbi:hypothetical protein M8J77_010303 [Diaphorina citri]|nr:hypothetical protein M8J77_010303 [Diaphorina citri]